MRNKNKELFAKMTPSGLRHVLESEIVTKLPGTDNQGRAIFLFRFSKFNRLLAELVTHVLVS